MKTLELSEMESIEGGLSWGCAFAIASTTGATLSFIFATGGSALLLAGVLKGVATLALYEACGDGWGDIY